MIETSIIIPTQKLTEEEIEKVILDNKEIFIFEDSGMGEGIDYSKLAKAIHKLYGGK